MEVLEEIARGGFGKVEKVRLPNGLIVARKTFLPSFAPKQGELEKLRTRFQREVRTQSLLPSAIALPVLDRDLAADNPWFSMPLADSTLEAEIRATKIKGEIPVKALADLLNALEELHSTGFIHRDLKPSNVLFHEGVWKLSDFGLVLPQTDESKILTSTDSRWGTQAYCAPEQVANFHWVAHTTDIYAFGCILHDIYSSNPRVPFSRHSADGPIGWIIEKCTEVDPAKRFQSISALRAALVPILTHETPAHAGSQATEWVDKLKVAHTWTPDELREFARALARLKDVEDHLAVYRSINEELLQKWYGLSSDIWKQIALRYCEWVEVGGFDFAYCDVLIRRLEKIFDLGDYETKAHAAATAATLGASHNRWFVMRRVLALCGPNLETNVAHRIGIEIQAREYQWAFQRCANRVGANYNAYHPAIAKVIILPEDHPAANAHVPEF